MGKTQKANLTLNESVIRPLLAWYRQNARPLPWRETRDPYAIWISEIMLQQTQVATVIPYWNRWMDHFPDLSALAKASETSVLKHWEGLGYYRRARMIMEAAHELVHHHQAQFPTEHNAILKLPGIGPYTAGAIASIAMDQPKPILDGNVIRVLSRHGYVTGNIKETRITAQLWKTADEWVHAAHGLKPRPRNACSHLNQSMMELGALICLPGKLAKCYACPISTSCGALAADAVSNLPNKPKGEASIKRARVVILIECGKKVLLTQQKVGDVNGGLWEFFSHPLESNKKPCEPTPAAVSKILETHLGLIGQVPTPWTRIRHRITRYRYTLYCFKVKITKAFKPNPEYKWISKGELLQCAMPSAHNQLRSLIASTTRAKSQKKGSHKKPKNDRSSACIE